MCIGVASSWAVVVGIGSGIDHESFAGTGSLTTIRVKFLFVYRKRQRAAAPRARRN
jgi:hypothetical protein